MNHDTFERDTLDRDAATPQDLHVDVARMLTITSLCLDLGRVDRATRHQDGVTVESVTDHTVSLSLVCCELAAASQPHLDLSKISRFCDVHDILEAICGDTDTLDISDAGADAKEAREAAAMTELRRRVGDDSYVVRTLEEYERLDTPEARFVRVVDKAMPKLTQALNGGAQLRGRGVDVESLNRINAEQREKLRRSYGADQPVAMELLRRAHDAAAAALTSDKFECQDCGLTRDLPNSAGLTVHRMVVVKPL